MSKPRANSWVLLLCGLVAIGAVAAVGLVANFGGDGFEITWPVLVMGLGLSLAIAGYFELGLLLFGAFLVWLLGNTGVLPTFSKSWPFALIWVAIVLIIGYLRARQGTRKGA